MKYALSMALAAALLGLLAPCAVAQMVVDRESGERVDYPYDTGAYAAMRRYHRHQARRHLQIEVVRSSFPTPVPFGWFNCCL